MPRGRARASVGNQSLKPSRACIQGPPKGMQFCFGYNLGTCKNGAFLHTQTCCVQFLDVTSRIRRRSTSDKRWLPPVSSVSSSSTKRKASVLDSEQSGNAGAVRPQLGASGYFCMELFCGSGNLTFAMKHFFPDSFGVDHKVGKQRVKIICLDLTKEDHQQLVMQWAASELCLWVHFGVPCGTASMARYKRLSKRVHGPPPLRSLRWPDGLPTVKGTNLLRLRAANRLYSFMAKLIIQLEASKITWTVENPWTSLLWKTSYWAPGNFGSCSFLCGSA